MTTKPVEFLTDYFRANEPQLVLASYSADHEARLQLLDWDHYRTGVLVCEGTVALCAATRWQFYENLSVHRKNNLPDEFAWLKDIFAETELLIVMYPLNDEDRGLPLLPLVGAQHLAYIVCKNAYYEMETNPGH